MFNIITCNLREKIYLKFSGIYIHSYRLNTYLFEV